MGDANVEKKTDGKKKMFLLFFFSALMSVSYLVHTPCIPIMMDINILFSKSPAQLVTLNSLSVKIK